MVFAGNVAVGHTGMIKKREAMAPDNPGSLFSL